jgi:hypothetical protein
MASIPYMQGFLLHQNTENTLPVMTVMQRMGEGYYSVNENICID